MIRVYTSNFFLRESHSRFRGVPFFPPNRPVVALRDFKTRTETGRRRGNDRIETQAGKEGREFLYQGCFGFFKEGKAAKERGRGGGKRSWLDCSALVHFSRQTEAVPVARTQQGWKQQSVRAGEGAKPSSHTIPSPVGGLVTVSRILSHLLFLLHRRALSCFHSPSSDMIIAAAAAAAAAYMLLQPCLLRLYIPSGAGLPLTNPSQPDSVEATAAETDQKAKEKKRGGGKNGAERTEAASTLQV